MSTEVVALIRKVKYEFDKANLKPPVKMVLPSKTYDAIKQWCNDMQQSVNAYGRSFDLWRWKSSGLADNQIMLSGIVLEREK